MLKIFSLLFIVASFFPSSLKASVTTGKSFAAALQNPQQPELESEIYLPVIFRVLAPSVFGVETRDNYNREAFQTWKMDAADAADVYWLRAAAFNWDEIEPTRYPTPFYYWNKVDEAGLIKAANRNMAIIGTIKYTPSWAQRIPPGLAGRSLLIPWMSLPSLSPLSSGATAPHLITSTIGSSATRSTPTHP